MDSSSERSTHPARPYPAASNYNNSMQLVPHMMEEEVDTMIENFAKADEGTGKTWIRLVVENFLSNVIWSCCCLLLTLGVCAGSSDSPQQQIFPSLVVSVVLVLPRKGFPNAPSLSKTYMYYEHITLPPYFVHEQQAKHKGFCGVSTEMNYVVVVNCGQFAFSNEWIN